MAVPAARLTVARPSSTAVSAGYVPDGLTEKEWNDIKNKKASAAAASKKKVASKNFEVSRVHGNLAYYLQHGVLLYLYSHISQERTFFAIFFHVFYKADVCECIRVDASKSRLGTSKPTILKKEKRQPPT